MENDERRVVTAGLEWRLDPNYERIIRDVRQWLETEHARLREQYEAVPEDDEKFDADSCIDWWLNDLRDLVDMMDAFTAEPDLDAS